MKQILGKPGHYSRVSIEAENLCVMVMLLVVFVRGCVSRNSHTGNNCQTENCDHQLAKLHISPSH
jgi:hypothetical protein